MIFHQIERLFLNICSPIFFGRHDEESKNEVGAWAPCHLFKQQQQGALSSSGRLHAEQKQGTPTSSEAPLVEFHKMHFEV